MLRWLEIRVGTCRKPPKNKTLHCQRLRYPPFFLSLSVYVSNKPNRGTAAPRRSANVRSEAARLPRGYININRDSAARGGAFFDCGSARRVWYPRRRLKPAWQNCWENTKRAQAAAIRLRFTPLRSEEIRLLGFSCKWSVAGSQFTYWNITLNLSCSGGQRCDKWGERREKKKTTQNAKPFLECAAALFLSVPLSALQIAGVVPRVWYLFGYVGNIWKWGELLMSRRTKWVTTTRYLVE